MARKICKCPRCGIVQPVKHFSWGWFLALTLLFGAGIYVYIPYWILFGKKKCPICGTFL